VEQIWLALSLTSLVTGFGLLVALLFLKRLAPLSLPPVVTVMVAFLVMGLTSFFGVYLRIISLPRSLIAYRLLNAGAWGYAVYALSFYVVRDRWLRPKARAARAGPGVRGQPWQPGSPVSTVLFSAVGGAVTFAGVFLAAFPPRTGVLAAAPVAQTVIMSAAEVITGALAIAVGVLCVKRSRATTSRPWRAFFRGLGVALLILIPANLLDFAVSIALSAAGHEARDGFVFAAGYGISNIVLIVAIVSGIRLSTGSPALAVPQQMVDAYGLTRREREVVEKLLEGKTDRRIAEELYISPRTVDTHLRSVFRKCSVSSRLQLTRLVSSYGELRNSG
jgi:DNA-binding CsgD family transcriptional regulator